VCKEKNGNKKSGGGLLPGTRQMGLRMTRSGRQVPPATRRCAKVDGAWVQGGTDGSTEGFIDAEKADSR